MIRIEDCQFKVIWSPDDHEYVGLCDKFPSLSYLSKDKETALRGVISLSISIIDDIKQGSAEDNSLIDLSVCM